MPKLPRSWNTANVLVVLGVLLLGVTFWVPYATASRVARIEGWAEGIARALLTAASDRSDLVLDAPAAADAVRQSLPSNYAHRLHTMPPLSDPPGMRFRGKHYLYLVTRTPLPSGEADPGQPLEVYAWPRSYLAAGRTTFFVPEDAPAAYSHNLAARYRDDEVVPAAGAGRPEHADDDLTSPWRGRDGERWLPLPVKP